MGTLVKEDFGRPDRANTMVSKGLIDLFLATDFVLKNFPLSHSIRLRECDMAHMISWMMMVLLLQ